MNNIKFLTINIKSWKTIFGVLLAGVTIYNVCLNTFDLSPPEILEKMIVEYKRVFHFPFRLLEGLLSVHINRYIKDGTVLWGLGYSTIIRTLFSAVAIVPNSQETYKWRGFQNQLYYLCRPFFILLLLWPIAYFQLLINDRLRMYYVIGFPGIMKLQEYDLGKKNLTLRKILLLQIFLAILTALILIFFSSLNFNNV